MELFFFKGFEQIAEGLGGLGTVEGLVVRKGRQVDDGDVVTRVNLFSCLGAIHLASEVDIH